MKESEAGSKKSASPTATTSSTGWRIPQDWPAAETPTCSRLTSILRSAWDSRHRTSDRVSGGVSAALPSGLTSSREAGASRSSAQAPAWSLAVECPPSPASSDTPRAAVLGVRFWPGRMGIFDEPSDAQAGGLGRVGKLGAALLARRGAALSIRRKADRGGTRPAPRSARLAPNAL